MISIENKPIKYIIEKSKEQYHSWDDWYREVVWYGNKKGAYLYGNRSEEYELEGHY